MSRSAEDIRAYMREWREENREYYRAYQRKQNLATKRIEGRRSWSEKDKKKAEKLLQTGQTFSEVAAVFGVSRSAIAGLSRRMRELGS